MSTLEKAIQIAAQAHAGQKDKAGMPYIFHPLRLMLQMDDELSMMAAVLHDVVEDSSWTIDALKGEGFPQEVISAVDHLTRRENEPYEDFIVRVGHNPLASRIKRADLQDNMDITRLKTITPRDLERLERYRQALHTLSGDVHTEK